MELKKSDKIIAVIGVIILIVAAILIAVYYSPVEEEIEEQEEEKTFSVTWSTKSGIINQKTYTADKNEDFEDTITIPQGNILDVEFEVEWEDDHTFGLLIKKGMDTLTVDIDGKTNTTTGSGNPTFTFTINRMPEVSSIQAKNRSEAEEKLRDYNKDENPSFTIIVTVEIGESPLRLLKFLRDQGNDFTIKGTYTYYDLIDIEEEELPPTSENPSEDRNPPTARLGMLVATGSGVRW
jgi:hypothetical protein